MSADPRVHCDAHTKDRPPRDPGHVETSRCFNARPVPLQMAMPAGTRCAWFAGCQNPATHIEPHPILSGVPACDRCPSIGR